MDIDTIIFGVSFLFLLVASTAVRLWVKRKQEARSLARYNQVTLSGGAIPPTLHPVFDPTRCIGSGACTRVCPQGDDVVGRIQGRGVLIDPSMCIGHGRCAASCPMGAIRLVFGTAERGVDIPHLSPQFETNVPGLYITGELGGMGLIANAVRQAKEGMTSLADALKQNAVRPNDPDVIDVAVIGAGPAGLTSALFAIEHNLSYRLFDKEADVGGAILQYPRAKIVMTQPMRFPLMGDIHATTMSKEQLASLFQKMVATHGIRLESGMHIEQVSRTDDGLFEITAGEDIVRARKVMLAIGRRGVPRKLGVAGENLNHVCYSIAEPDPFQGKRVLVVGGGDSAVETACMIADQKQTTVSLSYRTDALGGVKPANLQRLEALISQNRILPLSNSTVLEIAPTHVVLKRNGSEETHAADAVVVQIGGELPTALLQRFGIAIERHYGEETEAHRQAQNDRELFDRIRDQQRAKGLQNFHNDQGGLPQWLKWSLRGLGVATLAYLFYTGRSYYLLPESARRGNDALHIFSASGLFGHSLGYLAAMLMAFNLLYFIRKEFRLFSGAGHIQSWMFFHQFSGALAAITVLLHTGLILYNAFALALYVSLGIVVLTGIIGRYFFVMVPIDPRGRPLTHEALVDLSNRMQKRYTDLFGHLEAAIEISKILDRTYRPRRSFAGILWRLFTIWPYRYLQLARIFSRAKNKMKDRQEFMAFKKYATEMARIHLQLETAPRIKRLLGLWRSGHALLAMMTVALVIIHVIIEMKVGYVL